MAFAIMCKDKPGHLHLRLETRTQHIEYLKSFGDKLLVGGPLMDGSEDPKPYGTLAILDFQDRAEAESFANNDPYAKAGLFESVIIEPWTAVIGQWAPPAG
ncbi:MAG: hypothetical protein CMF31_06260 [Kordiimonas sp.]|nr:hypothetical protein [Kordiimonas sp.]|tara:strand:- start:97 stop:399 length:303 start_codon:yes stop_codon:yes gene_type:complete